MKNLLLVLTLAFSLSSNATIIELSFDKTDYQENETITGQLVASDLSYNLGGFAGSISFNPSELMLTGWSFGNGFDDGLGSYYFADDSISGLLYMEDFADLAADLPTIATNQGLSFVLASFTFNALSTGLHTVDLLSGLEVISFDNISLDTFSSQSASFNVSNVPEPATALLFTTCLLFLRRKSS